MTKNHEIKLAKVGKHVLVSGCEKPVPTRNFRILQAEKETKTDMMNPVMQRCSCREYAETAVPEELLPHCAKTQWHAFGHDLFSAAGGKQQAFAATLARYGLTPAQCMAFGDSDNDIGLLTAAGIGVAMEAGTDGARAAADFVTRDCEADGIRYALEYFSVL